MNKVIVEKDGPVKTDWMNRPDKRNALDSELLQEMIEALGAPVAADDRVVVIRGKGLVFCAGLDMAERSKSAGAGEASGIEIMLRAIELCPLPVVAVVQGDAIAGGKRTSAQGRGRFFEATLLGDVDATSLLMQNESFGPILPLASVDSPTIAAIVRWMDRVSDNFVAEMLVKELGAVQAARGTTAAGLGVVTGLLGAAGTTAGKSSDARPTMR